MIRMDGARTRRALLAAAALAAALSAALPAAGAGPVGHFLLSRKTIQLVRDGKATAPDELKRLLSDPECRRAYSGGAIGPDICEEESHYASSGDLARRLLAEARQRQKEAAAAKDDAAFKQAKRELAFAYGWLNHCATDLDVHPVVNARVGDTFRYLEKGGKVQHGALEAQLTAYLQQTIGKQQYDVYVPIEFLSKVSGVSDGTLRQHLAVLNGKTAGELYAAGKVTLTREQLSALWADSVRRSLRDAETLTRDPNALQNWDLDSGRLTPAEFDALRAEVMAMNGGKLPSGWGRSYLAWFEAVRNLSGDARRAKLTALLGKSVPSAANAGSSVTRRVMDILSRCDLVDIGAYGHITETGAENKEYRENIGAVSSSTIDPLDKAARVKFNGTSFSVVAEGQDIIYGGRVRRGRIAITGSVSPDGKTASAHAETYTIEEGSFDSTYYLDFVNVPLDVEFLREKQGEDIVRFLVRGKAVPGMVTRAETVFRYLNSDGTVKKDGVHRRVMDFKGDTTEPQVAIYLSRRR